MLILERPWTRQPTASTNPDAGSGVVWLLDALRCNYAWDRHGGQWTAFGIDDVETAIAINTPTGTNDRLTCSNKTSSTGQITLMCVFKALSVSGVQHLINEDNNLGGARNFQLRINSGACEFIPFSGNTPDTTMSVAGLMAGVWYTVIAQYRPGSQRVSVWNRGGGLVGSDTSSVAGALDADTVGTRIGVLGSNDIDGPFAGLIALAAGWSIDIQSEAMRLGNNPWGVYQSRRIYIPTPAAAGYTHPTLSAATATEITATSFKPRVTYTFA